MAHLGSTVTRGEVGQGARVPREVWTLFFFIFFLLDTENVGRYLEGGALTPTYKKYKKI